MNWKNTFSGTWIAEKFTNLKHTTLGDIQFVEESEANSEIEKLKSENAQLKETKECLGRIINRKDEDITALRTHCKNMEKIAQRLKDTVDAALV